MADKSVASRTIYVRTMLLLGLECAELNFDQMPIFSGLRFFNEPESLHTQEAELQGTPRGFLLRTDRPQTVLKSGDLGLVMSVLLRDQRALCNLHEQPLRPDTYKSQINPVINTRQNI